ncbi:MAG: hypothetical protein Q9214_007616 [Letrouitia sp. 1 TL-2023]
MKAVKAFKRPLERKRPEHMNMILDRDARIVQPPLSMLRGDNSTTYSRPSRSVETDDRKPIEQALASEGIHRDIDLSSFGESAPIRPGTDASVSPDSPNVRTAELRESTRSTTTPAPKRNLNAQPSDHRPKRGSTDGDHGKGHAHNPLEDHLFLAVGPGGSDAEPDPPTVSESPAAAETNIYETAYHEEIERIRSRSGSSTTLYLTRRVEKKKEYQEDEHLIGVDDVATSQSQGGLSRILGLVKKKEKQKETERQQHDDGTEKD